MVGARHGVHLAGDSASTTTSSGSDREQSLLTSCSSKRSRACLTDDVPSNVSTSSHRGSRRRSDELGSSGMMTRKRQLVKEVEEHLAVGVTPYWETEVGSGEDHGDQRGTPRRSRRGEARRMYEDVAGFIREHEKMAVNLPPMVSTREGKLLAIEVFGKSILQYLPGEDKGPRVGHCSSGFVCGYPVPRGKEGNRWCQTPVRASLESSIACKHHSYRRRAAGGASKDEMRYKLLAEDFFDQRGDLSWSRVVCHLRAHPCARERGQQRQVLAMGSRALAVSDAKLLLQGFKQCAMFWLAVCRLTRRGYRFVIMAHESKTHFRESVTNVRAAAVVPVPSQLSSPFLSVADASSNEVCYYASGYDEVCRMF